MDNLEQWKQDLEKRVEERIETIRRTAQGDKDRAVKAVRADCEELRTKVALLEIQLKEALEIING